MLLSYIHFIGSSIDIEIFAFHYYLCYYIINIQFIYKDVKSMCSLLGALIFSIITIINLLLIFGLPLGEFTMGGQYKVLPKSFRILAIISFFIQLLAIVILLQTGGYMPLWFSFKTTKFICFFFSFYLSLNTVMNFFSKSKKEKYIITPLSLIATICFWCTSLNI